MIPKTIHYMWFGGKPEPQQMQKYLSSWRQYMPNWTIKRWDESNFNIDSSVFCKQAYARKKWAFVADYARVKVLFEEGGVYLDTDEQIVKSLDPFCFHKAFFGLEPIRVLQAGVMGCEKNNSFMGKVLDFYNSVPFVDEKDNMNLIPIGVHLDTLLKQECLDYVNEERLQIFDNGICVYPSKYFCPDLLRLVVDDEVYSIHHPNGSWLNWQMRLKQKLFVAISRNRIASRLYQFIKR